MTNRRPDGSIALRLWLVGARAVALIASPCFHLSTTLGIYLRRLPPLSSIHESSAHCDAYLLDDVFGDSLLLTFYSGCGQLYEKAVCLDNWSSPQSLELAVDMLVIGTRSHWPTRVLTTPDVSEIPSPK